MKWSVISGKIIQEVVLPSVCCLPQGLEKCAVPWKEHPTKADRIAAPPWGRHLSPSISRALSGISRSRNNSVF